MNHTSETGEQAAGARHPSEQRILSMTPDGQAVAPGQRVRTYHQES